MQELGARRVALVASAERVTRDRVGQGFATNLANRGTWGRIAPWGLQFAFTATRPTIGMLSALSAFRDHPRVPLLLLCVLLIIGR